MANFLQGNESASKYVEQIETKAHEFGGFNLFVGIAGNDIFYLSNRRERPELLQRGVYGLSNHTLNTAWPKVTQGLARFKELISYDRISKEDSFTLLPDETIAADEDLPDTGIDIDRERQLSPIFIRTPGYGTRSSTVILFEPNGPFDFEERVWV